MVAESFLFYFFSSITLISGIMVIRSKNPVHSVLFLILVFCNAAGLLLLLHLDFFAMIFLVVYVGAIAVLFLFVVMMLHIKLTEMNENILRYLPVGGIIGFIFLIEVLLVVENDLIPLLDISILSNTWSSEHLQVFGDSVSGDSNFLRPCEVLRPIDLLFYKIKGTTLFLNPNLSYLEFLKELNGEAWTQSVQFKSLGSINSSMDTKISIGDLYSFQYIQWSLFSETTDSIRALGQILYTYYFYFFILASLILLIAMIGAIVLTLHSRRERDEDVLHLQTFKDWGSSESNFLHSFSQISKGNQEAELSPVKQQEVYLQNSREFLKTIRKLRSSNPKE